MKRKMRILILFLAMTALLLAGCGQADSVNPGDIQTKDVSSQGQQPVQDSGNAEQENLESVQDKDHVLPDAADADLTSTQETSAEDGSLPIVYMTTEISAESLMAVYEALGASPSGRIAVKLSTGEPGSNYLHTDLIGDFIMSLEDPTIVECNTAYGGSRANTAMHYQVAEDHGYTAIADVDIMDENGSMTLTVEGGDNLTENYVGAHFANYDYYVILSHFKGHTMAGFGARLKIFPLALRPLKGKHISTAAAPAEICGAETRMPFWNLWQKRGSLLWIIWTGISCISM